MKTLGLSFCMLVGLLMGSGAAFAQGIAPLLATYDMTKTVTKTGSITDLTWANTHCVLFFDAKDDDGKVNNLAIELTNPRTMIALHVTPPVLQPGKQITVAFNPATDKPNHGLVKTLTMNGKVIFDANRIQADIDDEYDTPAKKPKKK